LSSAQKRLYILDRLENESTGYNIPALYELAEAPDPQRLEDAFKQLIKRHESFRTCFIMVNDEPMQRIFENVEFEIEFRGVGDLPVPSPRPFDLSRAPLLRADLLKGPEGKDILFVDMHHTISDGVSMEIFQRELAVAYDSKELPPLKLQYKDYAGWQAGKARKEGLKEQETYWLSMYEGEIPVLNLPLDFARPVVRSFEGSNIRFELGKKETVLLKELARKEGTTLFTVLGALFNVLLSKLSGQEDIVVGSPAAGRRHSDLENMIGMFVNTLPLRNRPTGEKYFKGFIGEVKKRTLEVFENQDYQFEDLVERLSVVRDTARNPLFDVMFTMQNMEMEAAGDTGLKLGGPRYESDISKFDMTLSAFESAEGLRFELEYGTRLFKEETVNRFGRYFESIVSQVITNPGRQIGDIEIISEEEKRDILVDFNDTKTGYSSDKTIHQLFEEQVDKTPHLVSLVYMDNRSNRSYMTHMTYARLNEETGHLAHLLIEKGIKPGTVVGIMVPPSLEMMVGILAILKAGGAY
ncbi:MAG: AMP-binding protein, partial [bacterium]|nr:AMP-binding protein [bacterium]